MKSLDKLTNVEKAKLLFELHPDAIPGFIAYATKSIKEGLTTEAIKDLQNNWKNGFITCEYWIYLLKGVQSVLIKYGIQLSKSKNLFSDQLFDGLLALVSTTMLGNYAKVQPNIKFNQTINLLFT